MSETVTYRGEAAHNAEQQRLVELKAELDDARAQWATISAKRQNRLFDRRIRGYNAAQQRYNTLVAEYGRKSLADQISAAETAQDRNVIALGYIVDMQNQLRAETDKISDGKHMRKFGRAIGKWLTRGSKVTQFAKGAAVSVVAGAVGGLAGASVATLAAMRFAKGYVTSEVSGLGKVDTGVYHDEFVQDEESETLLERAQAKSAETFEAAGGDQQAKKRVAVRRGLGVMTVGFVVGGTVGSLIHSAMDIPVAHAAPTVADTYQSPDLSPEYSSSPGVSADEALHAAPGLLHESAYSNPGVDTIQPTTDAATDPGIYIENELHDSPQFEVSSYASPGLAIDQAGLHAHVSIEHDYSSPGITVETAGDPHSSPGLIIETSSAITDADNVQHSSPGIIVVDMGSESSHASPGLNVTSADVDRVSPDVSVEGLKLDEAFTVQYTHGYVHEIMDAARANDIKITSDQAWEIHKDIVDKVGTDYIDLLHHNGDDTYSMGDSKYETGISAPGKAEWDSQAAEILRDKFAELQADHTPEPVSVEHDAVDADATAQEFSSGAQHIGDGEGYYHELDQMGVPEEYQAEVLHEAAPQLYEQDAAYEMSDGLPGVNMTPDHMMTQESLDALHQAAIETNAGDDLTVTHEGVVFDEATDASSTTTTDNGEFLVSDFGQSYDVDAQNYYDALKEVDRSHWQDLLNEAAPQLQSITYGGEALTYHDADGWHFHEVDGTLPPEAREAIKIVADKRGWTLAA